MAKGSSTLGGEPAGGVVAYRACRNDSFFVDVPLRQPMSPAWMSLAWHGALASRLQAHVESAEAPPFEAPCKRRERLEVQVTSVLPQNGTSGLAERDDGHARFTRVRFTCALGEGEAATRRSLTVDPRYLCDIVERIRVEVAAATNVSPVGNGFFVGRECEASAVAGFEDSPTPAMQSWHYPALGLEGPVEDRGEGHAQLFLLDSGIHATVASALDVSASYDGYVGPEMTEGLHRHGSAMAILARQIAPRAALSSARVIDGGGLATSESLARGLDAAIFDRSNARRPLVIELSLGWPAPLARRAGISGRHLDGTACLSYEDPFGEPVRYGLYLAQRLDFDQIRPIMVVGAAGNRSGDASAAVNQPGPTDPFPAMNGVLAPTVLPNTLDLTCYSDGAGRMFPGAYLDVVSCGVDNHFTVLGVSAISASFAPAANAIENSETPLVAIGQHVAAVSPSGPLNPPAATCPTQSSFPPQVRLPAVLSGSSVSAAFVSGAAARAQHQLIARRQAPLRSDVLSRLLYLTGAPLCRSTANGIPVRRLDVGQLQEAIESCPALLACARRAPGAPIDAGTLNHCASAVAQCGLSVSTCAPPTSAPPVATPVGLRCGQAAVSGPVAPSTCSGSGVPCTRGAAYERYGIGGAGPQPVSDGCPYCTLEVNIDWYGPAHGQPTAVDANAFFELSPDFPPGTTFTSPQLEVRMVGSAGQEYVDVVDLANGLSDPNDWVPGNTLPVSAQYSSAVPFEPVKVTSTLYVKIDQGSEVVVGQSEMVTEANVNATP